MGGFLIFWFTEAIKSVSAPLMVFGVPLLSYSISVVVRVIKVAEISGVFINY